VSQIQRLGNLAIVGLALGACSFYILEPFLLGSRPSPLFERETWIYVDFWSFPLFVLPSVTLIVALLNPKDKADGFKLGFVLAAAWLIPFPLIDCMRFCANERKMGLSEPQLPLDLAVWAVHQVTIATLAAALAAVLYPVIRRRTVTQGKR